MPRFSYTYYLGATPLGGPPTQPGTYSVVAHYTSNNSSYASADSAPAAFTIAPAPLTVTGITASNKQYNANTTATLNTAGATLLGTQGSDSLTLSTAGAAGTFASQDVATGITVQVSGLTVSGAAWSAGDYTLTQPTTTANITAAP